MMLLATSLAAASLLALAVLAGDVGGDILVGADGLGLVDFSAVVQALAGGWMTIALSLLTLLVLWIARASSGLDLGSANPATESAWNALKSKTTGRDIQRRRGPPL